MSPNDRDNAVSSEDAQPSNDTHSSSEARAAEGRDTDDVGAEEIDLEEIDAEELMAELERLRKEVNQLRARQAASRHSSWIQRHPALTVFLTTALGAAAGYLGSRFNTSSDFSKATRQQLRTLAAQARAVASDVQHEIGVLGPLGRQSTKSGSNGSQLGKTTAGSGANGAVAASQTPAGDVSAGAPDHKREGSSFSVEDLLQSVAGTASRARESVQTKAKSATQDAAAKAVRNFASEDDLVPVEVKAKAAGMAATTLGAALARKLVRSAGSVLASMLIAYLSKKVIDVVLRR